MNQNRSIQDIIPPARSRPVRPSITPVGGETPPTPPPMHNTPVNPKRPSGMGSFAIVIGVGITLLVIGVGVMSTVFYKAYVTVTPHTFTTTLDTSVEIAPTSDTLSYQNIEVTDTITKKVPATGSQQVENHAVGTITIYNAYTTSVQRLITNTRFETKSGLIYRIHQPVDIPGYTMKAGVKVPGSVEVQAYADQAGDTYNIPLSDFTIPGLKGSKQYDLMYAKSKTAMTGGFIGEQAVVDATLRASTVNELKASLDRSIREKIYASEPSNSVVFDKLISVVYAEAPDSAEGSDAIISISATASVPAINGSGLGRTLASIGGIPYQGLVMLQNPNDLNVQIDSSKPTVKDGPLTLLISGTAHLVAEFDQAGLTKDLAGKNKNAIKDVLPSYPAIASIDVKIYPFWRGGIPTESSKLKIEVAKESTTNTKGS